MENKLLEDIISDLKSQKIDVNDLSKDGVSSISNMMKSLQIMPEFIRKNLESCPPEQKKLIDGLLKEIDDKLSSEYIRDNTYGKI